MKTVMDAVKYYGGRSMKCENNERHHTHIVNAKGTDRFYSAYRSDVHSDFIVCTIGEFNRFIGFLSTNIGNGNWCELSNYRDAVSLGEVEKLEPLVPVYTQEMYDNGELPSVGMECLVLNSSCSQPEWTKALIKYVGDLVIYAYCEKGERCDRKSSLKFKPLAPPIELVDGKAYQLDYNNGSEGMSDALMRYRKSGDYFYFDNTIFERKFCTNIIRLTAEIK